MQLELEGYPVLQIFPSFRFGQIGFHYSISCNSSYATKNLKQIILLHTSPLVPPFGHRIWRLWNLLSHSKSEINKVLITLLYKFMMRLHWDFDVRLVVPYKKQIFSPQHLTLPQHMPVKAWGIFLLWNV